MVTSAKRAVEILAMKILLGLARFNPTPNKFLAFQKRRQFIDHQCWNIVRAKISWSFISRNEVTKYIN